MLGPALLLLTLAIASLSLKIWWSRRHLRRLAKHIPGPPTVPLLGNANLAVYGAERSLSIARVMVTMNSFSPFRIWVGPSLYVVLTKPEDVELLARHGLLNADTYLEKVMSRFVGSEHDMRGHELRRKQRAMADRVFNTEVLDQYMDEFNKQSKQLIFNLSTCADGSVFDPFPAIELCILFAVWETFMGTSINSQQSRDESFIRNVQRMLTLINERSVRPWVSFDCLYHITPRGREQKVVESVFRNLIEEAIASRIEEGDVEVRGRRQSFLDVLIRICAEQGNLTARLMTDEVCAMISVVQATLVTTTCFALVMLGMRADLQEKIVQELRGIFSDDWNRPVTVEDLEKMDYLDRFIKETLRLFPVMTCISGEVKEDLELSTCTLPAGCQTEVLNYFTHREPRHWPDPELFDPDRFLPDRSRGRHPHSYLPYGVGTHMCVGGRFPSLLMKTVLVAVLRSYRTLPAVTQESMRELHFGLVLKPVSGFKVKLLPR